MKRLIQWSIDHHWMVLAFSLLLLAGGIWTALEMPVDVFPDLTAPTVTILTEGHGMAPDEMESLVTFPLESAINGASGVRRVRSATAVGIAVVWVEFDWGTDIFAARQVVAEKLSLVSGALPPQVERPILAPISSIMGEILFFAISSDARRSADAAHRRGHGGAPAAARRARRLAGHAHWRRRTPVSGHRAPGTTPRQQHLADRAAGRGPRREPEHVGRHLHGRAAGVRAADDWTRAHSPEEIGDSVVGLRGSRSVLIRDVADVREGGALKRGEGSRSGKPAVIVGVQKQPGANTIELTARLDRELDALQHELPPGMTIDRRIFRQADFIEVAGRATSSTHCATAGCWSS